MFREMRRKNQQLSEADTIEILRSCTSGVLAVSGDNDYPYAVPTSYVYTDGKLYFHHANEGHLLDSIGKNNNVSFCVIQMDQVIPQSLSTHYRSAIVFGRARILTDDGEKRHALECVVDKYSPGFADKGRSEIEANWNKVCVVEIAIEHMTGKAAKELISDQL